jgi:ferredoxin
MLKKLTQIPKGQKFRYAVIILAIGLFFAPLLLIPQLFGNSDLCGPLCMRRFYLYFPGMTSNDLWHHISVAVIGTSLLLGIFLVTFFFGRIWCAYICPVGGFPELLSRMLNDRWKIEYRALPQVPIRYGYFSVYLVALPMLGVSACTLCNFMTVPKIFEAFSGEIRGIIYLFSAVGAVNLGLFLLLGVFASKGRAYCQFLCPIGAIDALVNRLGARFHFSRRIRVERNRCTGCNICARNCMCGAIKMVNRVAVVDQLSCMSCHECVDVCDWSAIDWRHNPLDKTPKRKKKGVDIHPQPVWTAIYTPPTKSRFSINWQRVVVGILLGTMLGFIVMTQVIAAERHADPDGCLSCHALPNLDYVDKQGILRSASINTDHYYASLHGSVPCRDCHRKMTYYPHKPENGAVDCADSCHLEEPSQGEAYTHKPIITEFVESIHGTGWTKNLTGGNRLEEETQEINPSCRRCHSNDLYIEADKMTVFQQAFNHHDQACGTCHQGTVWRDRIGGHILRRLLGARWNKIEANQLCKNCHANIERMQAVKVKHPETGQLTSLTPRFILATKTYNMTLHNRLLATNVEIGATCNDCHAPTGLHHAILPAKNPQASTHPSQLRTTCAQSKCHAYANNPLNQGFIHIDLHDIDQIPPNTSLMPVTTNYLTSNWYRALAVMLPIIAVLLVGSLIWSFFITPKRSKIDALFGGEKFMTYMIGVKRKNGRKT